MGQLLNGSGGNTRLRYNLFVQPIEPEVKNGLWIKTPSAVTVSDVLLKNSYALGGNWAPNDIDEFSGVDVSLFAPSTSRWDVSYYPIVFDPWNRGADYIYLMKAHVFSASYYTTGLSADIYKLNFTTKTTEAVFTASNYVSTQSSSGSNLDVPHMLFDNGIAYVGYSELNAIYDMNTGTVLNKTNVLNSVFRYSKYLARKDDKIYSFDGSAGSSNGLGLAMYSPNTATMTRVCSLSGSMNQVFTNRATYYYTQNAKLFSYKNELYFCEVYSSKLYLAKLNPETGTYSFPVSETVSGDPYIRELLLEGCKLYAILSDGSIHEIDLDAATITDYAAYATSNNGTLTFAGATESKGLICLYVCSKTSSSGGTYPAFDRLKQFVTTNTVEPNNTLCIQGGENYEIRVIGVDKALKKMKNFSADIQNSNWYNRKTDFKFSNAWYYDTDFREYPTYIGDGTQWTKIKN